jgi:AraC-like DNA-binding protein
MELHLRESSSPAVRNLAGWYERVDHPVVRREVPGGRIVLVISFGPPLEVDGRSYGSFVAGLHETAAITEHAGVSHGVQAYLTPLGAERLFRMPMGELANGGADLADLLDDADELAERLHETPGWPARLALLEAYIERRVAEAPRAPREIEWSWQRLLRTDGAVPVAELAEEVGWSRRHLAARFREHVGLPPKALARILRFERAAERLRGGADLADAALDSGYYDQAHFNRDFKAFAGVTPTQYRVTSVQDIQSVPA